MTVSRGNFNVYAQLSPVRVVAAANVSGTYYNGQNNNGVGATLTVSSLTVDSVALKFGDSVLLSAQTAANQNGIYYVSDFDGKVLTRREDLHHSEQLIGGAFVPVAAGTVKAGSMYVLVEPLPGTVGVNNMSFVQTSAVALAAASASAQPQESSPLIEEIVTIIQENNNEYC